MAETTAITTSLPTGGDAIEVSRPASSSSPPGPQTVTRTSPPGPPLSHIYALPAPIRTFPLPTFYPSNPISLFHLVYAWLSQVFRPPPREPSAVHIGVWDPETRSVHVREPTSVRALWEQGFYGKGSLSRSEPNWLKRELARRGSPEGKTVSEARTELRREERRLAKWERAKAEMEAIERQRLAEAASLAANAEASSLNGHLDKPIEVTKSEAPSGEAPAPDPVPSATDAVSESVAPLEAYQAARLNSSRKPCHLEFRAPVGPAELLALPNSLAKPNNTVYQRPPERKPPVGPAELLLLPNSPADLVSGTAIGNVALSTGEANRHDPADAAGDQPRMNGDINGDGDVVKASVSTDNNQVDEGPSNWIMPNGVSAKGLATTPSPSSNGAVPTPCARDTEGDTSQPLKRRKSVRFSPTVEATTFQRSDPPSPSHSAAVSSKSATAGVPNGKPPPGDGVPHSAPPTVPQSPTKTRSYLPLDAAVGETEIENKEHFQLAPEEAFFLVFSLGALRVVDSVTGSPIPTDHLLSLFRSYSYFPPRSCAAGLRPDDPFLVHYAVYHHFRSLGWVPRHGVKFGVDWILYQRGPVFDHSEFGIMVMPAYSKPLWKGHEHEEPKRSWSWLMGVNRVLSHALKSLVLVYVDIPPPIVFDEALRQGGVAAALKKYTIREVMVRRFSVNRNR